MENPWQQTLRLSLVLLALITGGWLIWQATPLIEALLIAAMIAILLNPAVSFLTRRTRLNRSWAGSLVFILFLAVLAGLPALAGTLAFGQFRRLGIEIQQAISDLQSLLARPINLLGFSLNPEGALDYLDRLGTDALRSIPGGSLDLLGGVTANLLWGLVILVSLFYLMKEAHRIKPWLVGLLPSDYQADARHLIDEIEHLWTLFFRVQILIFLILAALFALGTAFVVILFRTGLLPFSFIALILLLALVYTLVQQVDNLWLRPQLLGRRLDLHPGVVFVALIAALALSGVLGALIVVPCLATVKTLWRFYWSRIASHPPPTASGVSPDLAGETTTALPMTASQTRAGDDRSQAPQGDMDDATSSGAEASRSSG